MIQIDMDDADFERLWNNSTRWGQHWEDQLSRFRQVGSPWSLSLSWRYAYWFDSWGDVLLARAFLNSINQQYQIASDEADGDYVIVTNHQSPRWRKEPFNDPT